jgi:trehalose 6-phosphate synthase/phosphatase
LVNDDIERQIARQYRQAARRILFLDYDGTLVPFSKRPELAVPDQHVLKLLQRLTEDPRNTLVIISGRGQQFLDRWFRSLRAVLAAEHGGFVRLPGADWAGVVEADHAWKQQARPVLRRYTDECPGALIEEKNLSLVWHYRSADPEISRVRAPELKAELNELVARDGTLQVLEGHKVIEIKKSGYDKGSVVRTLLGRDAYDFLLALGDDRTDEDLFRALPAEAVTIKVGLAPSRAKYNLADQEGVIQLLGRLLDG